MVYNHLNEWGNNDKYVQAGKKFYTDLEYNKTMKKIESAIH